MNDEDAFVQAMLATPQDDDLRLVYADWLEERGATAKAEFLRLSVQTDAPARSERDRRKDWGVLRVLAGRLDAAWLAVVSRLRIENCQRRHDEAERQVLPLRFEYLCDRRWQDLQTTADPAVRHCDRCKESVHFCDTIGDARGHAFEGHCVAVNLKILREDGDLEPVMLLGDVDVDFPEEEEYVLEDLDSLESEDLAKDMQIEVVEDDE